MISFVLDHCFSPYTKMIVKTNMKSAGFIKRLETLINI